MVETETRGNDMRTIAFVESDEFKIFSGAGWVVLENGKRIDWPMLRTREEAQADLKAMRRADRELAADEASEAKGLRYMGAID